MRYYELRRQMILAMGSRCAMCNKIFDPKNLIIDHIDFPGMKIGYNIGRREVYKWHQTGQIPQNIRLLCDDCNRKRHGYRPSKKNIFGFAYKKREVTKMVKCKYCRFAAPLSKIDAAGRNMIFCRQYEETLHEYNIDCPEFREKDKEMA